MLPSATMRAWVRSFRRSRARDFGIGVTTILPDSVKRNRFLRNVNPRVSFTTLVFLSLMVMPSDEHRTRAASRNRQRVSLSSAMK